MYIGYGMNTCKCCSKALKGHGSGGTEARRAEKEDEVLEHGEASTLPTIQLGAWSITLSSPIGSGTNLSRQEF